MKNNTLLFTLLAIIFAVSCRQTQKSGKEEAAIQQILRQADSLNLEVNTALEAFKSSERSRMNVLEDFMKRFAANNDTAQKMYIAVKESIYTPEQMNDFNNIYRHDTLQDKLVEYLTARYIMNTPFLNENKGADALLNFIRNSYDSILNYKLYYEDRAEAYNKFLKTHRNTLDKAGEPYNKMQRKPVFTMYAE
jgi:hypothetical protein